MKKLVLVAIERQVRGIRTRPSVFWTGGRSSRTGSLTWEPMSFRNREPQVGVDLEAVHLLDFSVRRA
jgi:hypothetical protein